MSKKLYWGLGVLILLLGAFVFMMVREGAEIQELETELAETEEFVKWWKERNATPGSAAAADKQVDVAADKQVDVKMPDKPPADMQIGKTLNLSQLSPEEMQQIFDLFYIERGLDPPPPGYQYRWKDIDVPLLDENGKPVLHKVGEPIVEIETAKAFSPTAEEYEMLKALDIEAGSQRVLGNTAKAEQLEAEYYELYSEVMRERPVASTIIWVATTSEKESDPDKPNRIVKEKLRSALIDQGFSHLIPILEETGEL